MQQFKPIHLILGLLGAAFFALALQKPIPQSLDYHKFADDRAFFGIANFWNVVSNVPFFFIGLIGLYDAFLAIPNRVQRGICFLPFVLSLGIFATSLGSAYYHYAPDSETLVWDRLPMTLMFMALFSMVVYDFCGKKEGDAALILSVIIGIFSVYYWQYTEAKGEGDLRLYALVQFYPLLLLPFIFIFYGKKVDYTHLVRNTALFYVLAKISEYFDKPIFEFTQGVWSGHTIKHFLAAIALWYCVKLMKNWRKVALQ